MKRGRKYHGCGDVFNVSKGNQYHLPFIITGRKSSGEQDEYFGEENLNFVRKGVGKNIKLQGTL